MTFSGYSAHWKSQDFNHTNSRCSWHLSHNVCIGAWYQISKNTTTLLLFSLFQINYINLKYMWGISSQVFIYILYFSRYIPQVYYIYLVAKSNWSHLYLGCESYHIDPKERNSNDQARRERVLLFYHSPEGQ